MPQKSTNNWVQLHQSNRFDVLELQDTQTTLLNTHFLSEHVNSRNPDPITAKLTKQFLNLNVKSFRKLKVEPAIQYSGEEVKLKLKAHNKIGAIPLRSPVTFKPEFSLIIKPRFNWSGIGPILTTTGWKVLPNILKLPQLQISERRIPPWVLSSVVLGRLEKLIKNLDRQFIMEEQYHSIPKGKVDWNDYAQNQIPKAQFLNIKCNYPQLTDNEHLKSLVHYALLKQKNSLDTQRDSGIYVIQLLDYCNSLIHKVDDCTPRQPNRLQLDKIQSKLVSNGIFNKGIEAITWTAENKGLGGLGDLNGLPWVLNMEELFESYVESILEKIVYKNGGTLKSGRKRETVTPINWDPPFIGSQGSLIPDMVIERNDRTFIIDAKYKEHWEDLNISSWYNIREKVKEHHRNDLLQILAYSSIPESKEIACCLMYPCKKSTWTKLVENDRHIHSAEIIQRRRRIKLHLTAVPLASENLELNKFNPIFKN